MKIRPIGAQVLVVPLLEDNVSEGGIVIPDMVKQKSLRGRVISIGDGHRASSGVRVALDVKPDDYVIYADYVGQEVDIGGVTHKLLHEEHILGVIEGSDS